MYYIHLWIVSIGTRYKQVGIILFSKGVKERLHQNYFHIIGTIVLLLIRKKLGRGKPFCMLREVLPEPLGEAVQQWLVGVVSLVNEIS